MTKFPYALVGGLAGNNYGNLKLTHQRTSRSVVLNNNKIPVFQGTLVEVNGTDGMDLDCLKVG
ncbi:MAG: hypothetical protein R2769_09645 [Saprospiraceae bacterium]